MNDSDPFDRPISTCSETRSKSIGQPFSWPFHITSFFQMATLMEWVIRVILPPILDSFAYSPVETVHDNSQALPLTVP